MKIKPQIYAKTLVELAPGGDLKKIARSFWVNLQKNKQSKDLKKIVELIDEESAVYEHKILARVYSKNALSQSDLELIKEKIAKRILEPSGNSTSGIQNLDSRSGSHPVGNDRVVLKNEIGKNITGFVVKVQDKILDLSLENKVNKLKKALG